MSSPDIELHRREFVKSPFIIGAGFLIECYPEGGPE
jgi:hypothetical protein